ncbi:MAG: ATP-binding protein, partial [Leptolyngbyaceae cyanobacterium CSU_1_3]|nr:ATP-binding protein [Leptolyngbyaceae cyanobacterium CSU_1_3]
MNDWQQQNWRILFDYLAEMRQVFDRENTHPTPHTPHPTPDSALDRLCAAFELSHFERKVLLLCAGMELQADTFADLCATAQGDPLQRYPTFQLAMRLFAKIGYWDALTPDRPLRRWRLIEVEISQVLMLSPIRIDERILHYLAGSSGLDERIGTLIQPMSIAPDLVPSHQQLAKQLAELLVTRKGSIVQLCGADSTSKRAIATTACNIANLPLYSLSAQLLPTIPKDLQTLILLWQREVKLASAVLLLDCDLIDETDKSGTIAQWINDLNTPLIVNSRERRSLDSVPMITFEVHPPTTDEQYHLWEVSLGQTAPELNGQINTLVEQFSLNAPTIQTICTEFKSHTPHP